MPDLGSKPHGSSRVQRACPELGEWVQKFKVEHPQGSSKFRVAEYVKRASLPRRVFECEANTLIGSDRGW